MTNRLPLTGLRVVEFSHMVMGPSCGLILADLGADVIKVEPVGAGDNTRRLPGSGAGFFPTFNRNKRSLAVNLKEPKGLALVKKLLSRSDIMTENFRIGALDALGLGYEALSAENPALIYCSLKGFLTGPYEHRAALDEVVQMMGGLAYMTGPPGQPLRAGASVNDIMGGMFGVIGILSALQQRASTGRGQFVRSALFENNVFLVAQHMAQYAVTGVPAAPMPVRTSAWAIYDIFETANGDPIFLGVVSDSQWRAFCEEFGLDDLLADAGLATNALRVAAREVFMARLRHLMKTLALSEIIRRCERAGLPFAPVKKPEDLLDDPHLAAPGAMVRVSLEDGRTIPVPAMPLEMNGSRFPLRLDVPRAGEHSVSIAEELGLNDEEIKQWIDKKILGSPVHAGAENKHGGASDTTRQHYSMKND